MPPDVLESRIAQAVEDLKGDPENDGAFRAVEGLLIQRNQWDRLATMCERVGDSVSDPLVRAHYYLKAGQVHEEKLRALEDAARCYQRAAEQDAGEPDALLALVAVRRRQQNWPLFVVAVSNHLAGIKAARRRVELLVEAARVRHEHLGDPEGATADLKRALREEPNYPGFLDASESVFEGAPAQFAAFLESLADSVNDPVVVDAALTRAMEVHRDDLGDLVAAARIQQRLVGAASIGTQAWHDLLDLYERAEAWSELAAALEQERTTLANRTETPRLIRVLRRLGEVYDARLLDPAAASDVYLEFLRVVFDAEVERRLQELLTVTQRWDDLVTLHVRAADRVKSDDLSWRDHLATAAQISADPLGNLDRAAQIYERILEKEPEDLEVLRALCHLHEERERWADLATTCERLAEACAATGHEEEGREWLDNAASVYEFQLSRFDAAAAIYDRLLDADPADELVADALLRVRRQLGEPRALAEALARFAQATGDTSARVVAHLERGDLYLEQLADMKASESAYRAALALNAQSVPGWRALQKVLRQAEKSDALLEALDAERVLIEDGERMAALQREAATLLEADDAEAEALERWEDARRLSPESVETLRALRRHYDREKQWSAEAGVLRDLGRFERESRDRAAAYYSLAVLIEETTQGDESVATAEDVTDSGGDPAALYAERALELDGTHLGAISFLRQRAEQHERWEEAVELLEREAARVTDSKPRAELLHRAAEILRGPLEAEERAAAKDAAAVAVDPRLSEAARPLADWYYRQGRFQEAEPLYQRFGVALALEETPESRADTLFRYATVCRALDKEEEALLQLKHAVHEFSGHLEALEMLAGMHRERGEWPSARDAYLGVLTIAIERMDTARQVDCHFALARIGEATNDIDEAIQRYNKVIGVAPDNPSAARALVRLYREQGKWRDAVGAYELLLPHARDADETTEIHVAQGELLGNNLDDWDRAVAAFSLAVKSTPDRPEVREALARALRQAGKPVRAADQYERLATHEGLPVDVRIEHWLVQAAIYEELQDERGAQRAYEKALELDPSERRSLGALSSLYEEAKAWRPLVAVLEKTAAVLPDERKSARAELYLRAARILAERCDDPPEAAIQLRRALDMVPEHTGALEKFAEIMTDDPRFDDDARVVHHRLLLRDPLRTASLHRLAEAYVRRNRPTRAQTLADLLHLLRPATVGLPGTDDEGARPSALVGPTSVALTEEELAGLLHPDENGPLSDLIRLLDPHAARLYPPNISAWGPDISMVPESTRPSHLRVFTQALAQLLGLGHIPLHYAEDADFVFGLECTSPPSLIAGRGLLESSEADSAFLVSRIFLQVAAGRTLMVRLKPKVFNRLMMTAVAFFVGEKNAGSLKSLAKAKSEDFTLLKRVIPRKAQRRAREIAPAAFQILGDDPKRALAGWRQTLEWSADRAALLATGDVRATLERVLGDGRAQSIDTRRPDRAAAQLRSNRDALELARYASSRAFLRLQERLARGG